MFENLGSVSHCIDCLYFEDSYVSSEFSVVQATHIHNELQGISSKRSVKRKDEKSSQDEPLFIEAV
jgi:hypothetical protein